ncbi:MULTISPECIES: polysaccharide pyruvyl transferase family protein [Cellulomonas]|uniref:polysaccharide pyruvyl transferase family protein n=1 Tax=Cellulomonas TaxID=1707 RepID=UPI0016569764|nr:MULTISPECIES: polysaccharide pyruvyl transferase family protein [Cellulomonas]
MEVLASLAGQHDNVGDTVLRRAYLDVLRPLGRLHVLVGDKPDGYVRGLAPHDDDVLHRDPRTWHRTVASALLRGAVYAFDSGETRLTGPYGRRHLRLAPLLLANRLRGGTAVHTGVGVREPGGWRGPIASVLRTCGVVTWRDVYSRDLMGVGTVAPDWAFALGAPSAALLTDDVDERPLLAVALRHDGAGRGHRPPDDAWAGRLRAVADALGLQPVVVVPVARDNDGAEVLAARLGAECVTFTGDDHPTQEERLRAVYRRSRFVLADRLHAVVIGATEGALPVGLTGAPHPDATPDKVARTLEGAGIAGTCVPRDLSGAQEVSASLAAVLARRPQVMRAVVTARERLERLADALHAAAGAAPAHRAPQEVAR